MGHRVEKAIPFVIQSESELPKSVGFLHPHVPVLRKPARPGAVLDCLLGEIRKAIRPAGSAKSA